MTTPTVAEVVCLLNEAACYDGLGPLPMLLREAASLLESEHAALVAAERERDELRNRPCPYVHSSGEGTHYCTLPHAAEKELAELRKRVAEAPMVTFRLGYAEGLFEVDSAQEDHLVPTGQRVAIVPLREGE